MKQTIKWLPRYLSLTAMVACLAMEFRTQAASPSNELKGNVLTDIGYHSPDQPGYDDYTAERCKLDIYVPTGAKNLPTVVWFHGGGLSGGNKELPSRLKNQQIIIVAPNYRLFPKVKSPVYIKDAAAAVAWTFHNIEAHGGSKELIFISGHSAGGYLASMVGLDKQWLATHEIDANDIAGLIPFSGHTITHFTVREERGIPGERPIIDEMAPLYHVRSDAPPLVLITGDRELEMLGRYEENAYMMRMMKVAGHKKTILYELQGYGHNMTDPAYPILIRQIKTLSQNKKSR
ncbi:MAG: alpha/beta hydrolase [Verrucomicrobia bacterium]|nr:alpha/beta hydrolase [Verrucomicrobiota bacterium]